MKYPFPRACAGAVFIVALAIPASASAGGSAVDSVTDHAKEARSALEHVAKYADSNSHKARKQLMRNFRQTDKALVVAHDSATNPGDAADVLVPVVRLEDYNVESYAELVDELRGKAQELVAEALEDAMSARQAILDSLTAVMGELPPAAQEQLTRILANLFGDQDEEIGDIEDAIDGGVPADVEQQLGSVLDLAFGLVQNTFDQFDAILEIVPASVRPLVEATLGIVESTVGMIEDLLGGLLGGGLGGVGGGSAGGLGNLPFLGGLFGGGGGGGIPGLGAFFKN